MRKYPFDPATLDALPEELAELYRGLEIELLQDIADKLKVTDEIGEATLQKIRALRSHGISVDEIKKAVKDTAGISEKKLNALLDDVVAKNQKYYTELADLAKMTVPETLVDAAVIAAVVRQTAGELKNLSRSMGFIVDAGRTKLPPAQVYQWALDKAITEVQSGAYSYGQAIAGATKELADSGLQYVDYESGVSTHVDLAVRRAVMTAVTQINDKYTDQTAEYLDTRYFEISAHAGARDNPLPNPWSSHKSWQGKVYYQSDHGEKDPLGQYQDLVAVTGWGEVDGLCGINCRHNRSVFIPGVSERTYTDEQLDSIDKPPFEYEGKTYTTYEATQKQRQIESAVRHWKRRQAAATNDDDRRAATARIRILNKKYKEFSEEAGLRMQKDRMRAYIPENQ